MFDVQYHTTHNFISLMMAFRTIDKTQYFDLIAIVIAVASQEDD